MKKTNKKTKLKLTDILVFVAMFSIVALSFGTSIYAQVTTGATTIGNPFNGGNDLNSLIVAVLKNIVMPIAGVASVFFIIWAGFQYVMARGNSAKISEANKNLLYALIGVGVLLGAAGISSVVQNTIKSLITN